MKSTGTPLSSWLQRLVGWSPVRGRASRAESNRPVVNPNLHDWCFRLDRHAPSLMQADRRRWIERSMHRTWRFKRIFGAAYHRNYCIDLERRLRRKAHWSRCSLTRTGRSLRRGETEGSASEAADMPFGISNGKFQISNLRCEICNLRFRAERGRPIGRSRRRVPRGSPEALNVRCIR